VFDGTLNPAELNSWNWSYFWNGIRFRIKIIVRKL